MLDDWCSPPLEHPPLGSDEIHLWRAALDPPADDVAALARTLAPDERERAGRFVFGRDGRRFVVGRGLLRTVVGRYLDMAPADLRFRYGANGKPELGVTPDGLPLRFNVSHSQGLVVIAVARSGQLGVDVERVRPLANLAQLSKRICSAREQALLGALPANEQHPTLLRWWTQKEAYVKACGDGLAQLVSEIETPSTGAELARWLPIVGTARLRERWVVWEFVPVWGYVGALVTNGAPAQMKCWQWPAWT